ncbi:AAA family ATPase [Clostridium polynesiense]|uniref:AAA family ATPase n=1 Tax=Clostridium polynesiense TaxID=1325933 RepID=UPI00058F37A7|nr:AAA family ATPase [Clostridium polynesiense]
MRRLRIIIADTDENYMLPLQQKFAEEFFEKIDLEIISDEKYFRELFSIPQKAEILIISEELYDQSLSRHNISNVFVMMEQYEEGNTDDLSIHRLFKYTSIRELFNEITGKSSEVLNLKDGVKKEPEIVLICSASGGTGKTTVALGISSCLTKLYKKVLYIGADRLQTFQRMLDNPSTIAAADVYSKLANPGRSLYEDIKHVIRKEEFSYLPPFKAALMSLGLKYSIYEKIAHSAKKSRDYDYIVIDADVTFDEDKAQLFNIADKVVVVTEQTAASVFATNLLVSNINGVSSEKYIFVCNNFDKEKYNALISPNSSMKFTVNDYIENYNEYDGMKCNDLAKVNGMQKAAFLIL